MKFSKTLNLLLLFCTILGAQSPQWPPFDPCAVPPPESPSCVGQSILKCALAVNPASWLKLEQGGSTGWQVRSSLGGTQPVSLINPFQSPVADSTEWSGQTGSRFQTSLPFPTGFTVEVAFSALGLPQNLDQPIAWMVNPAQLALIEVGLRDGGFYFKRAASWGKWIEDSDPASYYRVKLWDPNRDQSVSHWHHLFLTLRADGQFQIDDFQYGPAPGFERKWYSFVVEGGNVSIVSNGTPDSVASTQLPEMAYFSTGQVLGYLAAYNQPLSDDQKLRIMAVSGQYSNTQLTAGMRPDNTGCYQKFKGPLDRNFLDPVANPIKTPGGLATGNAFPWNFRKCDLFLDTCANQDGWQNSLVFQGSGGYFHVTYAPSSPNPVCVAGPVAYPAGGKICAIAKSPDVNFSGIHCNRGETCEALDQGLGVALRWDFITQTGITKPFKKSFPCTEAFFSDVPNYSQSPTNNVLCTALGTAHPPSPPTGFNFAQSSNNTAANFLSPVTGIFTYPMETDLHVFFWATAGTALDAWPSSIPNSNHYFAPTQSIGSIPPAYFPCPITGCPLDNPGGIFTNNPPKRWIMATYTLPGGTVTGVLKAFRTLNPVACDNTNFPVFFGQLPLSCSEAVQ